jgi:hypothetical protein
MEVLHARGAITEVSAQAGHDQDYSHHTLPRRNTGRVHPEGAGSGSPGFQKPMRCKMPAISESITAKGFPSP